MLAMRSSNARLAWFAIAALAAGAVPACGGSSGDVLPTVDASSPNDANGGMADAAKPDVTTSGPDASLDAASTPDAPADVTTIDDGAVVCNTVTNSAPAIKSSVADAATPPAQTGGTIASGTYFLTSATSYGGNALCGGINVQGTAILVASSTTAGSIDGVIEYSLGAANTTQTVHATYATSGSTLSLTATCPANDAGATTPQYSATATTITVVQPAPPPVSTCGTVLEVFTKQ